MISNMYAGDPSDHYWQQDPKYVSRQCLKLLRGATCWRFEWEFEKLTLFRTYGNLSYEKLDTTKEEVETLVRLHAYRNALRLLGHIFRDNKWARCGRWNENVSDDEIDKAVTMRHDHVAMTRRLINAYNLEKLFVLSKFQRRVVNKIKDLPDPK